MNKNKQINGCRWARGRIAKYLKELKGISGNVIVLVCILLSPVTVIGQEENRNYQYALIEAVKQKNLGNLPGAIELYKMVIEENDSVAVAYYELGTLYSLTGRREEAMKNLETAYTLDPGNKWFFGSYMDLLLALEETAKAGKILRLKLKEKPDDAELLFLLANAKFLEGKERKAIRILSKIEKERGISERITLLKANIYEQKEDYDRALEEIENIIQLFPESIQFRVVAAELALKSKQKDKAAEYYVDVFEIDSLNIYAITNLTDYYRDAGNIEKSLFYLNKSFESSEIEYDRKMAILSYYLSDPEFFNTYNSQLEVLLNTMLEMYPEKREIRLFNTDFFIQRRDYPAALNALQPLLVKGEQQYELWEQGLLLANATENTEAMLSIAEIATAEFPDSMEIFYFKGIAEYELERYEDLIETFSNESFELTDNRQIKSQTRSLLAEAWHRLGEYEISDSLFRLIIEEEPDNHAIMNNFSYYLSLRGVDLEEAEKLSRITIDANPDNGTFLDTYAWILFKMGRHQEAAEYILKALKFGGDNDPDVNEHAAEINLSLGSYDLARAYFEKALALGGDKDRISERLEYLEQNHE